MIDSELLRRLGWSEDLIKAVNRVAEPLRESDGRIASITAPHTRVQSVACGAIYSDAAISNTLQGFTVLEPESTPSSETASVDNTNANRVRS